MDCLTVLEGRNPKCLQKWLLLRPGKNLFHVLSKHLVFFWKLLVSLGFLEVSGFSLLLSLCQIKHYSGGLCEGVLDETTIWSGKWPSVQYRALLVWLGIIPSFEDQNRKKGRRKRHFLLFVALLLDLGHLPSSSPYY